MTPPRPPAAALAEGDALPDFHLPTDDGGRVCRADFAGRTLVLFCYPRADTPGCTTEAKDFSAMAHDFADARAALLGLSADPIRKLQRFRAKHDLTVPLATDESHASLIRFGVWGEKMLYGKRFEGILRTTYLVGANGRIARIWHAVKVAGHAAEVLHAVRSLPR